MKPPGVLVFAALLVGAAPARAAKNPDAASPNQASPISASRIREAVRVLSSDAFEGRGPGQAGEDKTLAYLVQQFKAAGLEPGGAGGSWLQDVPLAEYVRGPSPTASLAAPSGARRVLKPGEDITLAAHGAGRIRLPAMPIVFVGYGVKNPALGWDSFAGADLNGKAALILANDPDFEADADSPAAGKFEGRAMVYAGRFGAKVAAAQAAGAAAVFVIHEDAAASYPWRQVANSDRIAVMDIASDRLPPAQPLVSGWLRRDVAVDILKAAGLDLQRLKRAAQDPGFRPIALKGQSLSLALSVSSRKFVSHNVLAKVTGRSRPQDVVLYGAHWDANGKGAPDEHGDDIRNGAVDNATGTAELIEVARAFANSPRPERTLLFIAYTAEEKGLLGSDYYASHPIYPLEKTAAVINLDPHIMLDRARALELVGGGRTDLEDDLQAAATAEGLRVDPEPHPEAGWYFRSDHFSFAKRGVPAVSFRIGRDLVNGGLAAGAPEADAYNIFRYHQPGDAFDPRWTFAGSAQEASVAWRLGVLLASEQRWPAWRQGIEYAPIREQTAASRE